MKINNKSLFFISIILFILYLLSFSKIFNQDNRKILKTALLNPKYKEQVTSITLNHKDEAPLIIKKNADFWIINYEDSDFYAPANQKHVEDFLFQLTKVINVYKITDKISSENSFSFDFSIKISYADTYSELIFGKQDFSKTLRYFMTEKTASVYQIGSELENFLTASERFWTEPYIISKELSDKLSVNNIQRILIKDFQNKNNLILTPEKSAFKDYAQELLELRHAGIYNFEENLSNEEAAFGKNIELLKIILELGNKEEIELTASKGGDDFYKLCVYYKKYAFTSYFKISQWTFSKLSQK